ncbi:MAG: redoxin domain-containing protein [Bacteroidales bacterium]|jgi:hypothetical protein|nr:redoxin domain-containing protein [Bacteroidales bacterium]
MKRIIFLITIIVASFNAFSQTKYEFIDIYGEKIKGIFSDTTYLITFSSQNCHQCYEELSEFLEENKFWNNSNINIFIVVSENKTSISNATFRKHYYNSAKSYFDKLTKQQIFYNTNISGDKAKLFSYKYDLIGEPKVFIIVGKKVTMLFYEKFINQEKDDEILLQM